jgi:HK97 family phage major capsid protein
VNARLVTEVLNVLDAQILVGTGTAPQMAGIIPQVGAPPVAVTAPQSFYDALIAQALAIESLSGLVVDSVVMSASTYALVTGQKSTTAGNYLVGVPSVASLQTIGPWRLALNSSVAAGTALLGAFATGSILLTRGGVRVDMSNAADDNFSHDLITVRAEVRAALALVSPRGFGLVTGITAV